MALRKLGLLWINISENRKHLRTEDSHIKFQNISETVYTVHTEVHLGLT
jgi:hypothetical protein